MAEFRLDATRAEVIFLGHEQSVSPWKTDEVWLLPPSVADFVPAGHAAHMICDLVSEELDLSAIMKEYAEPKGYPPYHPAMMVALVLYAYRSGVYSSRRMARACRSGWTSRPSPR